VNAVLGERATRRKEPRSSAPRYRLGIDVGGTFTDVVLFAEETGQLTYAKVPSVPGRQHEGVLAGIERALAISGARAPEVVLFTHGTTVATNALLERKGARVGMITTRGFRDVLAIGRQTRPKLYDFRARRAAPLISRDLRIEVAERILPGGEIGEPLAVEDVREAARRLRQAGVESIVVGFLHSYVNPEHERAAAAVVAEESPEVSVSLSSAVLPEHREYERFSTTAVNAYVEPVLRHYIAALERECAAIGLGSGVYVMQSNGGLMPAASARGDRAVHTTLSGPAGGVLAAQFIGGLAGFTNIMAIDMGGTSFDVSLVRNGEVGVALDNEIAGYPIRAPMFDIVTLGAGGGSIAWIDEGGALRVGPRSAGARPGPACYGRGGTDATVTDAHLALGRLDPRRFLGGEMVLDEDAARRAIEERVAQPLGVSVEAAAFGVLEVANAAMLRGMRVMTVERGYDPREFILMAFGGAGPLHALDLARAAGFPRAVFPVAPGLACALGLLTADIRHDFVVSVLRATADIDAADLAMQFARLEARAVERAAAEGVPAASLVYRRHADVRYSGQGAELTVPVEQFDPAPIARIFEAAHHRTFGYAHEGRPTEIVSLRLTSVAPVTRPAFPPHPVGDADPSAALIGERRVITDRGGATAVYPVYARERLAPGHRIPGPAIVVQLDSTIVLDGQDAVVDPYGNIIAAV
jgi:N-methylhydantoinase A